jgi:F-type H+-transporting ATPase subunit epsilon
MKEINIEIITPSKSAYKGNVRTIWVPGQLGNFQVLFNHAPILSNLNVGRIKIENVNGQVIEYSTGGGTVEVNDNKVLVLADSVELKEEVDAERAKSAYKRAKERLAAGAKAEIDVLRAEVSLQRAINRMKFAGLDF